MRVFTGVTPVEMDRLPAGKTSTAVAVELLGERAVAGVPYTLKVDGVVLAPDAAPPKSASTVEVIEFVPEPGVPGELSEPMPVVDDGAAAVVR